MQRLRIDNLIRLTSPADARSTVWRIVEEPTATTLTVAPAYGMFNGERNWSVRKVPVESAVLLTPADLNAECVALSKFIQMQAR